MDVKVLYLASGTFTYGEVVWFRRPDAGAKSRVSSKGLHEATVANKHWLTEKSTYKP